MSISNIVISTGGSGGHVFPAISLAKKLVKEGKTISLVFDARSVNFAKHIDFKLLNATHVIGVKSYKNGALAKIKLAFILLFSIFTTLLFFLKTKPKKVISFGSYATFPVLACAVVLRIPIYLHEQNAVLGRVNKLFFPFAKKVFLSFPNTKNIPKGKKNKVVISGNFIRVSKDDKIKPKKHVITIIGGSQGAKIMGALVPKALQLLKYKPSLVYHQVRKDDLNKVRSFYKKHKIKAQVEEFFENIHELIQRSSFVIARAGASTIAELLEYKKPAILLPYPYAKDNHQYFNALYLLENKLAEIFDEKHQSAQDLANLIDIFNSDSIEKYLNNYKKFKPVKEDISKLSYTLN